MPVIEAIAKSHPEMTAWRRELHAYPELALQEVRTSARVAELLSSFGVDEVHRGLARTGVVGVVRGRTKGAAIGLRADMDALPIQEATGLPYASRNAGVMHACGHDGHTAMLLGAARYLAATRGFAGTVYLIFQPAEEDLGGGEIMVCEGLFDRFPMRAVYGLHNWPTRPAGVFLFRSGPIMAACADFDIIINGRGGHAAHPEQTIDAIWIAAQVVNEVRASLSHRLDPFEQGVVSFSQIAGGNGAYNIVPEAVCIRGTARWLLPDVGQMIETSLGTIAADLAARLGASASFSFRRTCPATVNDVDSTLRSQNSARQVVGTSATRPLAQPSMGAEDFAFMLEKKKGSYIILGAGRGADDPPLHHNRYDFNDDVLPIGASYWAALVQEELGDPES